MRCYVYSVTIDDRCYVYSVTIDNRPWIYQTTILIDKKGTEKYIDGLVQERLKSSALTMELRLSCTKISICQSDIAM